MPPKKIFKDAAEKLKFEEEKKKKNAERMAKKRKAEREEEIKTKKAEIDKKSNRTTQNETIRNNPLPLINDENEPIETIRNNPLPLINDENEVMIIETQQPNIQNVQDSVNVNKNDVLMISSETVQENEISDETVQEIVPVNDEIIPANQNGVRLSVYGGILFVNFQDLLGDRFIELANLEAHQQCINYATLEEVNVTEIYERPTLWLNISVLTVRLLQLIRNDPRQIGLISPIYFDQQWHNDLFSEDPSLAFLTKPEFTDLILAPIYQNRNHFTMAIIKFDEDEEIVKIYYCDSFGHDILDFTTECLIKIVTAIYPEDLEYEFIEVTDFDRQTDYYNCAPFAASNAECFLRNGRIMALGESGYEKRWNLKNQLGAMFNHQPLTQLEIENVMNGSRSNRIQPRRNNLPATNQKSTAAKYQENRRLNETDIERQYRLNKDSQSKADKRAIETDVERQNRLNNDSQNKANKRKIETAAERRERLDKQKVISAKNRQTKASAKQTFNSKFISIAGRDIADVEVVEYRLSVMNIECIHCGAKHCEEERVGKGNSFNTCCRHGKVELEPLPEYPEELKKLMLGLSPYSKEFFDLILLYNNNFSFADLNVNMRKFSNFGPYCYSVQGQIKYKVDTNVDSQDVFFVDTGEAIKKRLGQNPRMKENILKIIEPVIRQNPFAQSYMRMGEIMKEQEEQGLPVENVSMVFDMRPGYNRKIYAAPTCDEVAVIYTTDANGAIPEKSVIVKKKGDRSMEQISWLSPKVDPWCYPLLLPKGTFGWSFEMEKLAGKPKEGVKSRVKLTRTDHFCYRVAIRNEFNPFLMGKKLTQRYFVDSFVKRESDNLMWLSRNQKTIQAVLYKAVDTYLEQQKMSTGMNIGRVTILPSSFTGSPRYMLQNYQDAMALVLKTGKPDIFITMTCNGKWESILQNLLDGQTASDRPDIVARVFDLMVDELIEDIHKKGIFGICVSYTFVIEFQKRGLPHIHFLAKIKDGSKFNRPEIIDKFISAELPDPEKYPELYEIITSTMIHKVCGPLNENSPCMKGNVCSKKYPKEFRDETTVNENGYPQYRRRDSGITAKIGKHVYDNRRVVPYNWYLSLKYKCHVNVEIVCSLKSVKYLHKYIYKGHDQSTVEMSATNTINHDEIKDYVEGRYVSAPEAAYRLLGLKLQGKSHTIYRLPVHLPDEHEIFFDPTSPDETLESLVEKGTALIDFFELNKRDPEARQYVYPQLPEHFVLTNIKVIAPDGTYKNVRTWRKRKQHFNTIGRMYAINPNQGDLYYLRMLLANVRGPTSFENLRTVNGVVHPTFAATCLALGLVEDDYEYIKCLEEASNSCFPRKLRILFANILLYCNPSKPEELWRRFKEKLSEDFMRHNRNDRKNAELKAYKQIDRFLRREGKSIADFKSMVQLDEIEEEILSIDYAREAEIGKEMYDTLNVEQKNVVNRIIAAASSPNSLIRNFFIDGPGGSGKTYLYKTAIHMLQGMKKKVITCAFTGIAAILLPNGRTCHKTFLLPVPLYHDSSSKIKPQSSEANRLIECDVIIWDEAPMAPRYALEIADRKLRELMNSNLPFGGKIILLGGDFRQLLPVKRNAIRSEIVDLSICSSNLWKNFQKCSLTVNMRARPDEIDFVQFLKSVGDGTGNDENERIELPENCITSRPLSEVIFKELIDDNDYSRMSDSVILVAKHVGVNEMNEEVLNMLPGEIQEYTGTNTIIEKDGENTTSNQSNRSEDVLAYLPEYLNSIEDGSLPPHRLKLKKNAIVMLVRNLATEEGLCNGTRMRIVEMFPNLILCEILTGDQRGETHFIPRINNTSDQKFFTVNRKQFPLKLAFSMTINKSQGQTFERIGIDLRHEIFSHGQLYVALSRARSWNSVFVVLNEDDEKDRKVKNIVFKELYEKISRN